MIRKLIAIWFVLISSVSYGQPVPTDISYNVRFNFSPVKDKEQLLNEKEKAIQIFEKYKETDSKTLAFRAVCDESESGVTGMYKQYTKDLYKFSGEFELATSEPDSLLFLARMPDQNRDGHYNVVCTFRGSSESDPSKKITVTFKKDVKINSLGAEVRTNIAVKFHGR